MLELIGHKSEPHWKEKKILDDFLSFKKTHNGIKFISRMISHPIAVLPRYIIEIPEPIQAKVVVVEAKDVQTTLKLFPTSARYKEYPCLRMI